MAQELQLRLQTMNVSDVAARGERVKFRIRDVRFPEPREVLTALHGNDFLEGRVLDFTDSGDKSAVFAVIQVREFEQAFVVPTDSLKPLQE